MIQRLIQSAACIQRPGRTSLLVHAPLACIPTGGSFFSTAALKEATSKKNDSRGIKTNAASKAVVYIGNIPKNTSEEEVRSIFGNCGVITDVTLVKDQDGRSRGYGSVTFRSSKAKFDALKLSGLDVQGNQLIVKLPQEKKETHAIKVNNLPAEATKQDLLDAFKSCGKIAYAKIKKDEETNISKGYGFVNFTDNWIPEKALKVSSILGQPVTAELVVQKEPQGIHNTLYVGNLPPTIDEDKIHEHFQSFGEIFQVRIAENGPRPYAHVEFKTKQGAAAGLRQRGKLVIDGRKLFIQQSRT